MDADFDILKKRIKGFKKSGLPFSYSAPAIQRQSLKSLSQKSKAEAVFKVASYLKQKAEVKNAMFYIAKNTEELIDEMERPLSKEDFNQKINDFDLIQERKNERLMIHFILSFPKDCRLEKEQMNKYMKEYLQPFSKKGFQFAFGVHFHQSAKHVHILLKMKNGKERLRFNRDDIFKMRQHQVEVAKNFGVELQATQFKDRDFSITGIIPVKKKTLLERQVPNWFKQREAEKSTQTRGLGFKTTPLEYDISFEAQKTLSNWSKGAENSKRSEQLFIEMYVENKKTALWYANNRAEVFGKWNLNPEIKITDSNFCLGKTKSNEFLIEKEASRNKSVDIL